MPPQPLHIFQKDLRHIWPETLVGVILLAAFAWSAPLKSPTSPYAAYAAILGALLHILIPIAWLVIIARLIQDEPLVGDRQFWVSRPYHWAKLLAAKLLYLLLFLYLPFFLMQVYLLKHAGLHPTTVVPALLHNLLLLTVILVLPITAIAAVTNTFTKVLLSTLGAIIYVLILVAIGGYLVFDRMLPPHISAIAAIVLILLPAAALVYQYATRRTAQSRLILIATPILALVLFFILPATALIRASYPVVPTGGGPILTPFPVPDHPVAGNLRLLPHNHVEVALPFRIEGVDRETDYSIDSIALTIDAPGFHWTSPYFKNLIPPGQINASPGVEIGASIPLDVFNQVHLNPADLHISIAADHLKAAPSTWGSSLVGFDIPGHGHCVFSAEDSSAAPICSFPFETPQFLLVSGPVSADCSNPAAPHLPARQVMGGVGGMLSFDPVIPVQLSLNTGDEQRQGRLCPGTPLAFIEGASLGHARLEIDDKHLILDPLAARNPILPPQGSQPLPSERQ